jgi:branched-chain amino acid aminotransferase
MNSAKIYEINVKWSQKQVERAVMDTVKKNKLKSCYIRPLMYFGSWDDPSPTKKQHGADLSIFALPGHENLAKWEQKKGIKCIISSWRKPAPNALPSDAKCSANYATSYLAALEAARGGYDYGILLDHRGFVSEALTSNIFAVIDGELITPPPYASILGGVTRDSIMHIARDQGIKVTERDMMPSELLKADEVFITGTASDLTPVLNMDGVTIGNGKQWPMASRLQKIYHSILLGKNKEYAHWLTKVY